MAVQVPNGDAHDFYVTTWPAEVAAALVELAGLPEEEIIHLARTTAWAPYAESEAWSLISGAMNPAEVAEGIEGWGTAEGGVPEDWGY